MHVVILRFGLPLLDLLDGLWSRIVEVRLGYCLVSLLVGILVAGCYPGCWWLRVRTDMETALKPVVRGIVRDPL